MGFFPLREASPLGSLSLYLRQIKEQTILLSDLDLENKFSCKREIDDQPCSFAYISDHFHEHVPRSCRYDPVKTTSQRNESSIRLSSSINVKP